MPPYNPGDVRPSLRGARLATALILIGIVAAVPGATYAQDPTPEPSEGPVVDVVEIAGVIDRPLERYLLERIADAEKRKIELLVFQVDSLGGLKLRQRGPVSLLESEIATASVPIAIHIGPRDARAEGAVVGMMAAADVKTVGPSARIVAEPGGPVLGASVAAERGVADFVAAGVADMIIKSDGTGVETSEGPRTLNLPRDQITVRFLQPGPIRRLLHTFSNPTLAYIMLIAAVLLIVFELFQPGFGVAGVTGGLLGLATIYGFTVLPVRAWALAVLLVGAVLLTLDVFRDAIGPPTVVGAAGLLAGSVWLYPGGSDATRLSPWVIGLSIASALVMFVPVMTVVKRAGHPIATQVKRALVGERGEVRSMLNPEGFALVDGEIWRARSEDGSRVRVGEPVVVASVDGTVLIVRPA